MKVYIVTGSWDDWESSGHWMVKGFTDESKAYEFRDRCQEISTELHGQYREEQDKLFMDQYPWSDEKREAKKAFDAKWDGVGIHPLDPEWDKYTDTSYEIEELEVDTSRSA